MLPVVLPNTVGIAFPSGEGLPPIEGGLPNPPCVVEPNVVPKDIEPKTGLDDSSIPGGEPNTGLAPKAGG